MKIKEFIDTANKFLSNYKNIHEYNIQILNNECQKEYPSSYYKLIWKNNKIDNSPEGMLWYMENG